MEVTQRFGVDAFVKVAATASLRSPSECRMLPVQIFNLSDVETSQLRININLLALFVVPAHPECQQNRNEKDGCASCQIKSVSDSVVWTIKWQETPCGDQTWNLLDKAKAY